MLGNPEILWMLWAVPALFLLYLVWSGRSLNARGKLASKDTRAAVIRAEPLSISWIRAVLVLLALGLFIIGLTRPLGGLEYVDIESKGIDIVLVADLSKSMLATDMGTTRLDYMKRQMRNLIRSAQGDRFGMVAFAGTAYVHMPLTSDSATALTFVDRLGVNLEIPQGTAIGDAIDTAVSRFVGDDKSARVIILFTDGESNKGGDPIAAAKRAAEAGVVIFPVGIGSEEGTYIPDVVDIFGRVKYKTDKQGRRVLAKLDEKTLRKVASLTGGIYYPGNDPKSLIGIFNQLDRSVLQTYKSRRIDRSEELAPLFLVAGLILLFMEAGLHYLSPPAIARRSGHYAFDR
jgi:Ca-activated chloride channel family protein